MFCVYLAAFLCSISIVKPLLGAQVDHIGCYKIHHAHSPCPSSSTETRQKISLSLAGAIQWIREQQKNGVWFDAPTSAWVMTNMVLAGYVEDGGICSRTKSVAAVKIRELLQNPADLPAGKLALVMLGLRSNCEDVRNFRDVNLMEMLEQKLKSFPADEFNNFYQYSLAVVALYANDVVVSENHGDKLIQYLLKNEQTTSSEKTCTSDTESMAVIALSAIMKQKGMSGTFLNTGKSIVDRSVLDITGQIERGEIKNLVTLSHALQVLQIHQSPFMESPSCGKLLTSITAKQNASGSYGDLMTSLSWLSPLSGVSLLNLRNLSCPLKKSRVAENDAQWFMETLKRRTKQNINNQETSSPEKVIVRINVESAVDGIRVRAHALSLNVKTGASALDALGMAAKQNECFRFHAKQSAWGLFVDEICGIAQNDKKKTYWMFYVNGKQAQVGPGKYVLKNKDNIVFRYMKLNW